MRLVHPYLTSVDLKIVKISHRIGGRVRILKVGEAKPFGFARVRIGYEPELDDGAYIKRRQDPLHSLGHHSGDIQTGQLMANMAAIKRLVIEVEFCSHDGISGVYSSSTPMHQCAAVLTQPLNLEARPCNARDLSGSYEFLVRSFFSLFLLYMRCFRAERL
jgi:hypothetical protein